MPSITPEGREKLAAYLRFQQELGIERLRIAPASLRVAPPRSPSRQLGDALSASGRPLPGSDARPQPDQREGGSNPRWPCHEPEPLLVPQPAPAAGETLEVIQADLGPDCRRCKLHQLGRHTIVFGEGNPRAELVFVGEGPGADEDASGRPFVGRGGQLLNDMIQKGMGLRRDQVYICNVIKCRPPGNRAPEADECAACSPFLMRQLRAIRPRIVCALGATAAQNLRPYSGSLASVRGRIHILRLGDFETSLVVTYHPAYLLRDPSQKREAWKDLQLIMDFLGRA
ncbi:MAG: uracil-DNA glycosylase [Terriglobales bacterium]